MFLHPEIASQLIRDRERQMLADASQRRLLRHPATARRATPATRIIRRLGTAMARARVAAQASGAIRPAGRHQLGGPAADAHPQATAPPT